MIAIRAVIFDMDGVLTDSEPLINAAAVAMFREKGLVVQPEDFLPFVGAGEDRFIGGVAEKHHFPLDLPAAKRRTYELYLDLVPARLQAFPGAVELVRTCRQAGLRVALASSADRIKVKANLDKIGLPLESWDAIVTGEDVAVKKPAPDIFLAAAAKLGVAAAECVVVEDAVNGVRGAKAAGMRCLAVAQTFPAAALVGADVVKPRVADVALDDLRGPTLPPTPPPIIPSPPPPFEPAPVVPATGPWGLWATFGWTLLIILAFVGVQSLVVVAWLLPAIVSGRHLRVEAIARNGLVLSLATLFSGPVVLLLSGALIRLRQSLGVKEYLGLRRPRGRELALWGVALFGVIVASDRLTTWLGRPLVPDFMEEAYVTAGFVPLLWLAMVVMAPVAEETLFRGFMFQGLVHSRLGAAGAVILPAFIWSAIHLQYDLYGIASIFAVGLLLGFARLKTGSLLVPLFLHALMNAVATAETAWLLSQQAGG